MSEKVKIIEQYEGCIAYDCEAMYYIKLEKGAQASDHSHPHKETVFLMEGKAEYILGETKQVIDAPVKIIIPPNTYHKFTALTDLTGLELKNT